MTIGGTTFALEQFATIPFELVVVGEFFTGFDISYSVNYDAGTVLHLQRSGSAVGLNHINVTLQL